MDNQELDQFEAYRSGTLGEEDKSMFERRLSEDPDLKINYQAYVLASESAEYLAYKDLKAKLQKTHSPNTRKTLIISRKWLQIAAAILLLLGFTVFKDWQYSTQQLVEQSVITPRISTVRSSDSSIWQEVWNNLQSESYDAVLSALDQLPNDPFSQLIRGYAYLQSDRVDEAIQTYEDLSNHPSNFQQQGEFQLALAYLKNEENDQAIQVLEIIRENSDHDYNELADQLLKDLENPWRSLPYFK